MSYSAPFPGKEWESDSTYFATGQLKFDKGLFQNGSDEPGTGSIPDV